MASVIGLLMNMEQFVEYELTGETEVLRENLPQCHFVNDKFHMTSTEIEPGSELCVDHLKAIPVTDRVRSRGSHIF
jgi:hypothetical protein